MRGNLQRRRLRIITASMIAVWGCNPEPAATTGPAIETPTAGADRVGRIVISEGSSRLSVGTSLQLTAAVFSETNKLMAGQAVQWRSSNPTIASVSELGLVHAENVGDAIITASIGDKVGGITLSVFRFCAQASATIGIGETRSGTLIANQDCIFLRDEPSQGWHLNVAAPAFLQIDLRSDDYFAHFALTDAQLRMVAQASRTVQLRLPAGSYIIWVAADFDDADYSLTVKAVGP